ncbi:hypothetical protein D3C77_368320 [compost metagenome]
MQLAHGLQQLLGKGLPLCQRQWTGSGEQLRQGLAAVFAHHVVQMLALAGGMYFGEVTPGHPPQEPFFKEQTLQRAGFILALRGQRFQQPGLLLVVVNTVKQRLSALAKQLLNRPAID